MKPELIYSIIFLLIFFNIIFVIFAFVNVPTKKEEDESYLNCIPSSYTRKEDEKQFCGIVSKICSDSKIGQEFAEYNEDKKIENSTDQWHWVKNIAWVNVM